MKRYLFLALTASLFLAACTQTQTTPPTTEEATQTSPAADNREEKYAQDLAYAINNPNATFPQLNTEIAENEAAVILKTSQGDIHLKLFPEEAPLAVENFLTHAKNGYYDGIIFHRVINGFMIQGGDPQGTGMGGESIWAGKDESIDAGRGFKNEKSAFLYNIRGALSMANAGPDTNGSQFFINQNPSDVSGQTVAGKVPNQIRDAYKNGGNPSLDGGYTVFGQVTQGMDVVDKIAAVETDENDKPKTDVTITGIEIVKDYSFE